MNEEELNRNKMYGSISIKRIQYLAKLRRTTAVSCVLELCKRGSYI